VQFPFTEFAAQLFFAQSIPKVVNVFSVAAENAVWRCLSYRASAGGYLLIECRGVAALQMRSSQ